MTVTGDSGARPRFADNAFVAPNASVTGDVTMGDRSSVWFSSTVRANGAPVTLGVGTDVQDNCLVDSELGFSAVLGDHVSMGHGATVHGSVIEHHVLIAMNATVMLGCTIGTGSIVGANSTVPPGTTIPPRSLVVGVEGRVLRTVSDEEYERIVSTSEHYMQLAREYREGIGSRSDL
jgi:carbonic anhydrase/acetyltransferase-like protein (isoleucine patch superfamily)